jgi:hypothetical protein
MVNIYFYNAALIIVFMLIVWLFIGVNGYILAKFIRLKSLFGVSNNLVSAIGLNGGPMLMYRLMTSPACTEFSDQVSLDTEYAKHAEYAEDDDGYMATSYTFRRWCMILLGFALVDIVGIIYIVVQLFWVS